VIPEPVGGAQRHPQQTIDAVGEAIDAALADLEGLEGGTLRRGRRDKYLQMGQVGAG
jgi:acetyl-CoA carboxylase carboxyl transferase subunit alpha